jgi:hypothetical protein
MKETQWNQLRGDGGTQPCPPEQLVKLKDGFRQMCVDAGHEVNDRRQCADAIRRCVWPGQSPDGRKHKEALAGAEPFPFEGASDKRERTADAITNEQVIIIMAALMRFNLGFSGLPGANEQASQDTADRLSKLWEYIERNQLAREWFVEWTRFAQWRQGDSPAVGVMQVYWHQEQALKPVTLTADDFTAAIAQAALAQGVQITEADNLDLQEMLANPARVAELGDLLRVLYPDLSPARATKAAADLQSEDRACEFPYPYVCENRLRLKARRLFHDIFVPENTAPSEMQRASRIDVREWFDEQELREMEAKGAFDTPGFVAEVLKHEGETAFQYYSHCSASGEYSESMLQRHWDPKRMKGKYELVTTFYRASNSDGIPGTYMLTWHIGVEQPGTHQRLLDYHLPPGCRYPFVFSPRELHADTLWESRGNSELSATDQQSLKTLHDMFLDNAQLATVPPIEVPASRPKLALVWGPLKQIKVQRSGEIKLLTPPAYPVATDKMIAIIKEGVARYFGQMVETNEPDLVRLYQQSLVDFMFLPVAEVMTIGTMLACQFLDDDILAGLVGPDAVPQVRDLAKEGRFHVEIDFEAGMLSMEFMAQVGEMISNYVLKWDTQSTIPRDVLVKWFLGQLSRRLANRLTRPVADANQSEIDDESNNFSRIAAGDEPPMMTEGQNWALRRQTLLDIGRRNPEAFAKLTPTSWEILKARLQHFDGQLEQEKNAIIGRTMAAPALPDLTLLPGGAVPAPGAQS